MMPFNLPTDPGSGQMVGFFAQRFPDANIHGSPRRDYEINQIVAEIIAVPPTPKPIILLGGVSLGCNNNPVVATYLKLAGYTGVINAMFGFQASNYGAQVPIPNNVLFAHEFTSDTIIPFPGIGAYRWVKAPDNKVTNLYITPTTLVHPGDYDPPSQEKTLDMMSRVIAHPEP